MNEEFAVWRYIINKIDSEGIETPLLMVLTKEEADKYSGRDDLVIFPVYFKVGN